jgi:glucokinase
MTDNGLVVAVDLGGTLTKMGLVAADGTVSDEQTVPTDRSAGPDGTVGWLLGAVASMRADHDVRGFGVVVPGIIDATAGVVRAAANLDWYDVALRDRLTAHLGLPGAVAHDVRSAGLAEWRLGAHADVADLIFVALGTGIAGAVVTDGRLLDADGYAGELGHVVVPAAGATPCSCGQSGCLETVASAAGLARTYARLASGQALRTAAEVADHARAGDPAATRAFDLVVLALVEALVHCATLLGPRVVIIGGGLSGASDLLVPGLERGLADRLTFQRRPSVTTATLGSRAGLVGAGLVGWDALSVPDRGAADNG